MKFIKIRNILSTVKITTFVYNKNGYADFGRLVLMKHPCLLPLLILALLTGCTLAGSGPARPTLTAEGGQEAAGQHTPSPIPTPCPSTTADQSLFGSAEEGFCFLYPADFYVYPSQAIILRTISPSSAADSAGGAVTITDEDLGERSIQDVADTIIAQNKGSGSPSKQEISLDTGYPAFLLEGFSGPPPWRALLMGHAGKAYLITFQPWDDSQPDIKANLERIYVSIVTSWMFTH